MVKRRVDCYSLSSAAAFLMLLLLTSSTKDRDVSCRVQKVTMMMQELEVWRWTKGSKEQIRFLFGALPVGPGLMFLGLPVLSTSYLVRSRSST